jgi:hypothetical protein
MTDAGQDKAKLAACATAAATAATGCSIFKDFAEIGPKVAALQAKEQKPTGALLTELCDAMKALTGDDCKQLIASTPAMGLAMPAFKSYCSGNAVVDSAGPALVPAPAPAPGLTPATAPAPAPASACDKDGKKTIKTKKDFKVAEAANKGTKLSEADPGGGGARKTTFKKVKKTVTKLYKKLRVRIALVFKDLSDDDKTALKADIKKQTETTTKKAVRKVDLSESESRRRAAGQVDADIVFEDETLTDDDITAATTQMTDAKLAFKAAGTKRADPIAADAVTQQAAAQEQVEVEVEEVGKEDTSNSDNTSSGTCVLSSGIVTAAVAAAAMWAL